MAKTDRSWVLMLKQALLSHPQGWFNWREVDGERFRVSRTRKRERV